MGPPQRIRHQFHRNRRLTLRELMPLAPELELERGLVQEPERVLVLEQDQCLMKSLSFRFMTYLRHY